MPTHKSTTMFHLYTKYIAGPSGVVADMLKAAGDDGTRWMTELCNAVVRDGKIPKDWSRSWLVNVYKGREMHWNVLLQRNKVGRTCHEGS